VTNDASKLSVYVGERSAVDGRPLADVLMAAYARRGLRAAVLLRGALGFGRKHQLRTDRLLTLSEDLPLVAIALDRPDAIRAAAEEAAALCPEGLVTVERAATVAPPGADVRLTMFLGRHERAGGRPAYVALVDLLRRHGVAGASVLLGVDGTAHGRRRRARLVGANGHVPLAVVAVGAGDRIAAALEEADALLGAPPRGVERITVCKRDGARIAAPGTAARQLTVVCGEQSRADGRPLAEAVVRELRAAGAAGATAVRGIWGFHADHAPHGDTLWQLRRRVPVLVTVIDTPERTRRWFSLIDGLTEHDGLVVAGQATTVDR
jgi:PII-like signaling protein